MAGGVLRRKRTDAGLTASAGTEVVRLAARPAQAATYSKPRSMTAAAAQVDLSTAWQERSKGTYSAKQDEAWAGYERVGEIHYSFNLVAHLISRLRIYAAALVDNEDAPMGAGDAAEKGKLNTQLAQDADEIMREITGPGFSRLVSSFALNMNVPAECYLIRLKQPQKDGTETVDWRIVSTNELEITANGAILRPIRGETTNQKVLPPGTYISRIWRPHPRYSGEPDSSLFSIADAIEELLILQRLVRSATRTRLNNGLLFLPDSLLSTRQYMALQGLDEAGEPLSEDELAAMAADPGNQIVADILNAIVTAVSDEGDASAVAPIMVTGEAGLAESIKHITFERGNDSWLVERTERALERILQGIDVPKEIVTGLANVKYSNALVIDENLYKANVEPLALVLVDSLTEVFLRPMLRAKGYSEADLNRIVVWYDPSEIVTRPNQAQDSSDGYDRMLVGPKAWRREHGFGDDDAPEEAELAMMLLTSGTSLPPDVQMALLQAMLPKVLGKQREANLAEQPTEFPDSAQQMLQPTDEAAANVSDAGTGENTA